MTELWCIHVMGPDSVIAQPDRLTALRRAHEWNTMIVDRLTRDPHPHDPVAWAVPEVWVGSAADHARDLADHGGQPEDIC